MKGTASSRSIRTLGEWTLFAAGALVPAATAGALGLRAIANEDAARRREMSAEVARVAERAAGRLQTEISRGAVDLEAARYTDVAADAPPLVDWFRMTSALAPSASQAVLVSPSGHLLEPAPLIAFDGPSTAPDEKQARECRELAHDMTGAPDLATRKQKIVERCPELRTDLGRYLWLSLAIEALALSPSDQTLAASLAAWIDGHVSALRPAERSDARSEISKIDGVDPSLEGRMLSALDRGTSDVDLVARALQGDSASRALRTERLTTRFQEPGALGALRPLRSGHIVGFVATPETVRHALDAASDAYGATTGISLEIATAPERKSDLAATEWLTDGLGVRARARDRRAFEKHTALTKLVVASVTALGAVVAVALAMVLFLRVRAARRTSALRTSFVAAVSHELRTPIASIRMLAELLEEDRVEPDEREEVHSALAKEARRLGETVDRLLGFTRMVSGRVVLDRRLAKVALPIQRAVDAFRERNPSAEIELALDPDVRAEIDEGQIEHVLANLLENARKYAPTGAPYRVGLRRVGDDAVISVADRGPGIPRAYQKRIFEAFERGDDRLSKATEGSGIGLSLAMYIAKAHGGRAWVESIEGEGATFYVSVPCAPGSSSDEGARTS